MAPTNIEKERAAWDAAHGLKPGEYETLTPAEKAAVEKKPLIVFPQGAKLGDPKPLLDEPQMWQVKFKSGQGQQVAGASADEVRALMATHYGEDYEIDSITELLR